MIPATIMDIIANSNLPSNANLIEVNPIHTPTKVKIFGNTALDSKITVEGILVSKGAKESIEKAGGKVVDANQKKEAKKTKEIDKGDES